MVLAQKVDNGTVPKSPLKVMFYYQPPICRIADFPVDVSLLFHTADRILHCSKTLCHIGTSCYKQLQTLPALAPPPFWIQQNGGNKL